MTFRKLRKGEVEGVDFSYLGISTGGDHFEADIAESVEDDHRVGPDTDPVAGLLGRSAAGVAGSSGAVELGLIVGRVSSRVIKLNNRL